ncbi:MAG: Coenzyme F420 hydrogenase/dehydrogenase, beta subunit C-terminal domain [Prevotella sp.]|nr:Coenzyme F420 hydrogenase/dehydrogenase, beta subunit C-terminal domain [Prevotella sp.]
MIQITEKHNCCGCGACSQVCPQRCIEMVADNEGFLYPEVNSEDCIHCGLCEKVCIYRQHHPERLPIQTLAAYCLDEGLRLNSSSGGIFTILAEHTIRNDGIVFGVCFDSQWNAVFDYVENYHDLGKFRGSKYVQAKIGNAYKECESFLKKGRPVLFTGTPCQIGGLKLYLRQDYPNLLTCDIICHGVPSPKVWQSYLSDVRRRETSKAADRRSLEKVSFCSSQNTLPLIKDINFRDKSDGWKKFRFVLTFTEVSPEDKRSSVSSSPRTLSEPFYNNIYMKAFLQNLDLRPSCHHCAAKRGRSLSDLTIADFWGIQDVCPQMDDDKGTGLLMINTLRGKQSLNYSKLQVKELLIETALKGNPVWYNSVEAHPRRSHFFKLLNSRKDVICLIEHELKPHITIKQRVKNKCRAIYYTIKNICK